MNWKETYTKIFLKNSGKAVHEASLTEYMSSWWQNTRSKDTGGLRLTDAGYAFVTEELELQMDAVPYPKGFEFTTNVIIWMDQFIDCPYYFDKTGITVTDEKKAMELHLFSGDVRKYGLIKAMNRQKDSKSG